MYKKCVGCFFIFFYSVIYHWKVWNKYYELNLKLNCLKYNVLFIFYHIFSIDKKVHK